MHKLVQAPRSSSDRASERVSRRSVLPCLGGARTCSAVPSSPQRPHRRPEGRIYMALMKYKIFEQPRFVAQTVQKLEMGAQHPISTPHLGVSTHQTHFKKMNRNTSHRFTFESKRTFYFTKISTSFPLVTSCPTACPVSQGSDKPPPPILRYGTRPSTDRAVRVLPRRYRDNRGPPRLWWSDIHPDIGPVSRIDHQSTAPPARG